MELAEPPEYVEFLAPYPPAIQELARALRQRLVSMLPPCVETVWDATNTVGVAYGFTERNADHFIHLPAYTKYVNIGFSHGALLDDPEGRLQGTGSRIRHVRLARIEDLDDYVAGLVDQAVARAAGDRETCVPRTIVRVMDGPKRRPNPKAQRVDRL